MRTNRRAEPPGDPREGARVRRRCRVPRSPGCPSGSTAPSRGPGRAPLAAARGTDCDPSLPRRWPAVPPGPDAPPPPPQRTRAAGFGAAGGRANRGCSGPWRFSNVRRGKRKTVRWFSSTSLLSAALSPIDVVFLTVLHAVLRSVTPL